MNTDNTVKNDVHGLKLRILSRRLFVAQYEYRYYTVKKMFMGSD